MACTPFVKRNGKLAMRGICNPLWVLAFVMSGQLFAADNAPRIDFTRTNDQQEKWSSVMAAERVASVQKIASSSPHTAHLRIPADELPVVINISADQYRRIAIVNPHAALALLKVMDEGKNRDTPMLGLSFYSGVVTTQTALDAWTAAVTQSKLSPTHDKRSEVIQVVIERSLEKDGKLLFEMEIVNRAASLVETGRSNFQFRLAPAYTVHPARPVYNMHSWQAVPVRTLNNVE
jgi:hypothetical protein